MSLKKRRLTSVDLFAGCGGLSLGLEQAGFRSILFSELSKDAADTYQKNLGGQNVVRVGPVEELTNARIKTLLRDWKSEGIDVDLVAGGPPCQGYSGIGHRRSYSVEKAEIPSNHLFKEMVRVVSQISPKFFVFENVRGLLSGRWTEEGEKGEIWKEVRQTFGDLPKYDIGWKAIHAKTYGVPQNRPRMILVGVRKDLGLSLSGSNDSNPTNNPRGLIPETVVQPPDLIDVLSDLDDPDFSSKAETSQYLFDALTPFQRLMRTSRSGKLMETGSRLTEQEYSKHSPKVTKKFQYMLDNAGQIHEDMRTKKFAQRLLPERWSSKGPTITATSLPDDFVHYARPRILTVREWARLQMFPDWFEFCGSRTTGGHRRAGIPDLDMWEREVPKYTQIGNAVPVGLAKAIGDHLANILRQT
jgi:DNA (cytosine-5)-methyltransferase 1